MNCPLGFLFCREFCIRRSTYLGYYRIGTDSYTAEPLKQLFLDIVKEDEGLKSGQTSIYTPSLGLHDDSTHWTESMDRLRRPLSTVILSQHQKDTIADDIRSFLTRSGVAWYQEKGLPRRLGYLFYGPPGTGKSSLAFALAGHFGLPIYMMRLSSPGLSDADVETLFSKLPFHCIVLLEDVDATQPLSRDLPSSEDADEDPTEPESSASDDEEDDPPRKHRPSKMHRSIYRGRGSRRARKPGLPGLRGLRGNTVTLSGLLNAIDGVAASEGKQKI